ncbi:MAG: hypothetical protein GEU28_03435 [Dehalococcoidia bacterium]|nr:hypothetical protein [Dehalococcoidia bacterium]
MSFDEGDPGQRRPLLIVDGDNLAHRAYHSMPKSVRGRDGQPINAVVGWTSMLLAAWDAEQPRSIFVGWDTLGQPTYRHRLWPSYQGGRVFDPEIVEQLEILPGIAVSFGFGSGKAAGYEADDVIAAAVKAEVADGGSCLVLTNDRDSYQLVSDRVTVLSPKRGIRELSRVGPAEVRAYFGVEPSQVPDFKALAGDSSDNIPGARGVGPKGAAALIQKYGGLEAVLEASKGSHLAGDAERLLLFREVVRMQDDVPVTLPKSGAPEWESAARVLQRLGAERQAERVLGFAQRTARLL